MPCKLSRRLYQQNTRLTIGTMPNIVSKYRLNNGPSMLTIDLMVYKVLYQEDKVF